MTAGETALKLEGIATMIRFADGTKYTPKDTDEVRCEEHGVITTWGKLDSIQKLAISEGLDAVDRCILLSDIEQNE